jgi:hypothetical protein
LEGYEENTSSVCQPQNVGLKHEKDAGGMFICHCRAGVDGWTGNGRQTAINQGTKLFQVRFYPVATTYFESDYMPDM